MAHTQYACRRRNTGTLRIAGTLAARLRVFTAKMKSDEKRIEIS